MHKHPHLLRRAVNHARNHARKIISRTEKCCSAKRNWPDPFGPRPLRPSRSVCPCCAYAVLVRICRDCVLLSLGQATCTHSQCGACRRMPQYFGPGTTATPVTPEIYPLVSCCHPCVTVFYHGPKTSMINIRCNHRLGLRQLGPGQPSSNRVVLCPTSAPHTCAFRLQVAIYGPIHHAMCGPIQNGLRGTVLHQPY